MNRFFFGNFDFEEQLRGDSQRSLLMERLMLELAPTWLAVANADDRIWCPGELPDEFLASLEQWGLPAEIFVREISQIPRGMELVPWGWSMAAIEFGERHQLEVNAPPLDVVRLANSREYSVPLDDSPAEDWDYATLCRTLGEVLACIERLPDTTAWVIKANWSHASRERILGRGPVIPEANIQWVKQRLARDGVVCWEPWLARECELGIQWQISQGKPPELMAITELMVGARGQYAGTRSLAGRGIGFQPAISSPTPDRLNAGPREKATIPAWATDAAEATRPAVNDLAQRGYFGPVGIDSMRYMHPDWEIPRTRTLQDINARWTMGRLGAGWFQKVGREQKITWWHGTPAMWDDRWTHDEWISTSPETINGQIVSHRTWLVIERL